MKQWTCLTAFVLLLGCSNPFAPKLDTSTESNTSILGDQRSIDGVFQNFKQAYAFRDSTIYGQLLAPNFLFVYRDYDKGVDVFWGHDDDVRTTYGLFQNVQRLDLVWNTIISASGDSLKQSVTRNFNLTVTFSPSDIVRVDGYANLTLERARESDVWRITRWRDESNF
ncbi:MAG: hypothetical protein PHP42_10975 [Bacteroidota bacterium]|nr:hypothetical protein [Bacteroidota bacterium]